MTLLANDRFYLKSSYRIRMAILRYKFIIKYKGPYRLCTLGEHVYAI